MGEKLKRMIDSMPEKFELTPAEIPRIDLYMDQILTLFGGGAQGDAQQRDGRTVTKTMINNYTKEHLIIPVKGKKYARAQMMQLLCVLELKQTLPLSDIRVLMEKTDLQSFEAAIEQSLELKARLREKLPTLLGEVFGELIEAENTPLQDLVIALTLSSGAGDLRHICEGMIDPIAPLEKKK